MTSEWVIAAASVVNAVVIIVFAVVTKRYADETKRIAQATRDQAHASSQMVEEMQEQRLATVAPIVILDVVGQSLPDYLVWDNEGEELRHRATGNKVTPWPLPDLKIRIHNAGRGPAVNMEATYFQRPAHRQPFCTSYKGFLLPDETSEIDLAGYSELLRSTTPAWEVELEAKIGQTRPAGIAVVYEDIHGRPSVTYLDLLWHSDVPEILTGEQQLIPVKERGRREVIWPKAEET